MSVLLDTTPYRIIPGVQPDLTARPTHEDGGLDRREAEERLDQLTKQMQEWQERLFAERKQSLLIVLQAMDAGGKDSTIRKVLGPLNPQGVRVWSFRKPSSIEAAHDFLWRIHRRAPGRGFIGVFNRSHYEDVLIVRVRGLAPESVWRARYEHISAFESLLHTEGTRVLKFFLHISREHQRTRLQRRLDNPGKHWKFNPDDLRERARWDEYMRAYEEAITRCGTETAPWYVVPAEDRPYRNLLVASAILQTLQSMKPEFPAADFDPASVTIQ